MRSALLALFALSAFTFAGCDSSSVQDVPAPERAQSWTAAAVAAPATDVFFDRLRTRPGGTIRAMIEASKDPASPRLALTSERMGERDEHRIGIEVEGVTMETAELFIKRLEDTAFISVHSAQNLKELQGSSVSREPQSAHWERVEDGNGGTSFIMVYDYQRTGAIFESPYTDGKVNIDHVGYRIQLKEHAPNLKQLRVDGYDEIAIASMKTLTAPEARARAAELFRTTK